jgi:hypothetical protein
MIDASSAALSGKTQLKFIYVYVRCDCCVLIVSFARFQCLSAAFINFLYQGITLICSEAQNEVNNSLLERLSSWIHLVNTAHLDNQTESVLSHFGVFVADPLAGEFGQLLIVSANNHLKRLVN